VNSVSQFVVLLTHEYAFVFTVYMNTDIVTPHILLRHSIVISFFRNSDNNPTQLGRHIDSSEMSDDRFVSETGFSETSFGFWQSNVNYGENPKLALVANEKRPVIG